MNQPIFEKITKLLRLAERATGAEAELALSRAHKLATEHQVDLATIDTTEGETMRKEDFAQDDLASGGKKPLRRFILWLLQEHFRVKAVVWNGGERINIVGRKSDVVFAQYLFSWLVEHFRREWKNELKNKVAGNGNSRRSSVAFFYGMYLGLNQKLKEAKREAEENRFHEIAIEQQAGVENPRAENHEPIREEVKGKYQLAVITEKDALEEEYYRLHPDLRNKRGVSCQVNHNALSIAAGRKAGARTRLPGLPLNNSTRSALA